MAKLSLTNVSKVYPGGVTAVESLSLEIADGEFMVLVGPSGCGKSTTLRMIAGLEDLTTGEIRIGDRVVNRLHPKDRDIAMVFQNYALYPHMTASENMSFGLKLRGMPKVEVKQRVEEAARLLGISDLLHRRPKELSGGQRQRVAVGRAIVRDPACFLFDEPLSNLDARLRVQMRAELKALHQRLRTTGVYVTHDQEEAMTLGDRIAIMSNGRLQQLGRPLDIYQRPVNRFVAGFLGMPPMNFLSGTVEARIPAFRDRANAACPLPANWRERLTGYDGRELTLGVRPEHLSFGASDQSAWRAKVVIVETLGASTDVYLESEAGDRLVARVESRLTPTAGDAVGLSVAPDRLHLFETGEFGLNLATD